MSKKDDEKLMEIEEYLKNDSSKQIKFFSKFKNPFYLLSILLVTTAFYFAQYLYIYGKSLTKYNLADEERRVLRDKSFKPLLIFTIGVFAGFFVVIGLLIELIYVLFYWFEISIIYEVDIFLLWFFLGSIFLLLSFAFGCFSVRKEKLSNKKQRDEFEKLIKKL